jgi:tetratricopeptide (TPR) repeat protein
MISSFSFSNIAAIFLITAFVVSVMITVHRKLNRRDDLRNMLNQAGQLVKINRLAEALQLLENADRLAKRPADHAWIAQQQGQYLLQHCQTKLNKNDLLQAIAVLKKALTTYSRLSQKNKQVAILNDLGTAGLLWSELEDCQNHLEEALQYLKEGLTLQTVKTSVSLKAALQVNLGLVYHRFFQFCPTNQRENLQNAITAFTAALNYYNPKQNQFNHDLTKLNLSICYKDLYSLEPTTANLNLALKAAQTPLKTINSTDNSVKYAQSQFNLGQILLLASEPEQPSRNRLRAFRVFKKAGQIYTLDHYPLEYAKMNYELAKIYFFYGNFGNNRSKLQKAIRSLTESLKIFDQKHYPNSYASCHLNCSAAFIKLAELERPEENLLYALEACEKVLKVYEAATDPLTRTATQFKIGVIRYRMADLNDAEANLLQSIEALESAFEVNKFNSPKDSTQAHLVLGEACRKLAILNPTQENLMRAADSYQTMTRSSQTTGDPETMAHSHAELGNALRNLAKVNDPVNNLHSSISALEQAVELYRQLTSPAQLAVTLANLGRSYLELARQEDSCTHLDKAIALFIEADKLLSDTNQPLEQAQVQMEQGYAYHLLSTKHERATNLTKAAQVFQASLKRLTATDHPAVHAMIQYSLGLVYRDNAEINEPEFNLTKAARAFEKSLESFTAKQKSETAQAQVECGKILLKLSDFGNSQTNLSKAIKLFETALKYYDTPATHATYGTILNHLGVCYQRLFETTTLNKPEYLQLAVELLEEAIKIFPFGKFPLEYAMTQNNLGTAYSLLATITSPKVNINKALQAFGIALQVFTATTDPEEHKKVKTNLEKLKNRFNIK